MKYPPIDPQFYEIDSLAGMTDDEIEADWQAYCDDMNEFCELLNNQQQEHEQLA